MSQLALRISIIVAVLTALVMYAGASTGEWRGAVVTEVHVLVVAGFAYACLRPRSAAEAPSSTDAQARSGRRA